MVPCGKCPKCINRRASGWSFRLMQQEKVSTSAKFLTFTYAPEFISRKHGTISENGFMSLHKRHLQLFFKRLRKAHAKHSSSRIKYYAVGEYGTNYARPHYHAILFNARDEDLLSSWGMGDIYFGSVTPASIGYCLKYLCKDRTTGKFGRDDRKKEFAVMSKGLGANYLTPRVIAWHKADVANRMFVYYDGDKPCSMPRYFKDKLYTQEERLLIQARMIDRMNEKYQEDLRYGRGIFSPTYKIDSEAEFKRMHKRAKSGGIL